MESTPHPVQSAREPHASSREFDMRFTSTPRGARLARRLVSHRLHDWGHPYNTPVNDTVTLLAAELTANAVRHGHVPGRDFRLRLTAEPNTDADTDTDANTGTTTIRIEVTDTRTERMPTLAETTPAPDAESGRGLLLVAALATRWGITPRLAAPGKTVWAQLVVSGRVQTVLGVAN
ncbi:ATP-binding protein [Streptomyces sp. PCS3-D2]|uniref:ATP-binding protein n=1 Tax=Streptomyces sp. PCS3-D2 TaxID=1460244 RepID=UPI001F1FCF86|nr:ATP-binding protein [Streptomyces sp. PCS3-D2]WKV71347.1 ATP-binding protein [Streptomyces sp. PCS3-D2]